MSVIFENTNRFEPKTTGKQAPAAGAVTGNAEFQKWWTRWAARVQKISARTNRSRSQNQKMMMSSLPFVAGRTGWVPGDCEFKRYL